MGTGKETDASLADDPIRPPDGVYKYQPVLKKNIKKLNQHLTLVNNQ